MTAESRFTNARAFGPGNFIGCMNYSFEFEHFFSADEILRFFPDV